VKMWQTAHGIDAPVPKTFRSGLLMALVGFEPVVKGDLRWHISVSHRDRVPSWEEMVEAAHDLRPGVAFVIGVPPRSWWVNVHPHCLHLWETKDLNLIAEWKRNARGDQPT